ncbi:MAG: hypothetical protein H6779_00370 [Candidatus Nomurabacteria bacterium]|nr:MAG: hypothetical protein H6779_00370 [Candidatus Nomurabacteria bacterium]
MSASGAVSAGSSTQDKQSSSCSELVLGYYENKTCPKINWAGNLDSLIAKYGRLSVSDFDTAFEQGEVEFSRETFRSLNLFFLETRIQKYKLYFDNDKDDFFVEPVGSSNVPETGSYNVVIITFIICLILLAIFLSLRNLSLVISSVPTVAIASFSLGIGFVGMDMYVPAKGVMMLVIGLIILACTAWFNYSKLNKLTELNRFCFIGLWSVICATGLLMFLYSGDSVHIHMQWFGVVTLVLLLSFATSVLYEKVKEHLALVVTGILGATLAILVSFSVFRIEVI